MDDRLAQTQRLYERAVFGGDARALVEAERHLNAVEADLALARGRVLHARNLDAARRSTVGDADVTERDGAEENGIAELAHVQRANELYRSLGDVRGEGEAQFWIGACHQVVRDDNAAAVPALQRARALATQANDPLTLSYALRHLGIAAHQAGHLDDARRYLEESTQLRRSLGFGAGVAANLVGLAYLAAAHGRRPEVAAILHEADSLCRETGAEGIARQVLEAHRQLGS